MTRFGRKFKNPWDTWQERGFGDLLTWHRERKKSGVNPDGWLEGNRKPTPADFAKAFPLNKPDWDKIHSPDANAIQAVWVGHATVLIQMGGFTFLTDPCFSDRCSPVQWAGPKRVVPPAFQIEDTDLPHIDFVLLSHNHYDHLDAPSVKRLTKRFGDSLTWYVPLGLKQWFTSAGVNNVIELDWWQSSSHTTTPNGTVNNANCKSNSQDGNSVKGTAVTAAAAATTGHGESSSGKDGPAADDDKVRSASITFVPAQHWSGRGLFDGRKSLWGGFVVKVAEPSLTFYFAGDSGYCPVFKEIGARLGPMDLFAIPIGTYEPRWFMSAQHVDPNGAVKMHLDVGSLQSLSIHCCTWALDEALDEPPRLLSQCLKQHGVQELQFLTLQHGGLIVTKGGQILNTPKTLPATIGASN